MAKSSCIESLLHKNKKIIVDGALVRIAQVLQSPKLQKKLVSENPEKAIDLHEFNETPSLGKLLVKSYIGKNEYNPRVALIAEKYNMLFLDEPLNPVKQEALDAEDDSALVGYGGQKNNRFEKKPL